MDNVKQQFKLYWKIRWLRRSMISAITLTAILLAIPVIIQYSITHFLIKQGATKADIEDINLNLFAGTVELKQLIITTADNKPSQLKHFYANINMLDLLLSKVVLHQLQIEGLQADIRQLDDGNISVNGLAIDLNSTAKNENEATTTNTSKSIAFAINELSITNSDINYQQSGFSQINQINFLRLGNLRSWEPSSVATLELDSILNNAAFKIKAEMSLFDSTQDFKGKTSLDSLAFSHYAKFYNNTLDNLQGSISFDSEFDISLSEQLSAKLVNTIQIKDLDANYQGIQPILKKIEVQGKTEISNINIKEFIKNPDAGSYKQDQQLNLFTGSVKLSQLAVSSGDNTASQIESISIDIDKLDALDKRLVLNDVLVDRIDTNIFRADNGKISINGLMISSSETTSTETAPVDNRDSNPITLTIHKIFLLNSDINYRENDFDQINHIDSIVVSNIKTWDQSSIATIKLQSTLNDAPFKLDAELKLFDKVKQFNGNTSLSSLQFSPYSKFYREHLDSLQGSVSIESEFDISLAKSISADVSSKIQLSDIKLDYQNISQSVQKISWNGNTQFSNKAELTVKGDLQINNNQTTDKKQNYLISSFDQLSINGLEKNPETISFKQLVINKLQLVNIKQDDLFVGIDKINIQSAELQQGKTELKINKVELDKPAIKIVIDQQKQLSHLTPLLSTIDDLSSTGHQDADSQPNQQSSTPLNIHIDKLELLSSGSLDFSDHSVSPNYKTQINLAHLDIDNISSTDNAKFVIDLKQGQYATFDIDGEGLLFDPGEYMQFTAKIKQLDLPPMTPYTSNLMGYGMKSGVVDSTINVKLKKREIDSEVDLKIDSIEVVETSKETAEQVSSASGMSIDLALSSLKDSDNVIDLKLPIKGNIDQPDFDLSQVINLAMGKAMKSATLSYLKHSLQPFGSLITLYSLAKKAANHISLPAVLFTPNSLTFKQDQQQLLDKVISVLNDRPGLKIKACGISAMEDQSAIKKQLVEAEVARLNSLKPTVDKKATVKTEIKTETTIGMEKIVIDPELIQQIMHELADARSAKVKAVFLEQGKLESSRILNCLSSTDTGEKSVPSVELLI